MGVVVGVIVVFVLSTAPLLGLVARTRSLATLWVVETAWRQCLRVLCVYVMPSCFFLSVLVYASSVLSMCLCVFAWACGV